MAKSQLNEEIKKIEEGVFDAPIWDEETTKYLGRLKTKLLFSKNQKESPLEEFDSMTYSQHWLANERMANTYITPKRNKFEVQFQSGTARKKLTALVSSIVGLNLQCEMSAYDDQDLKVSGLGNAMEDIQEKSDELDNEEEKFWLKVYELVKQGHVFVQDIWKESETVDKEFTKEFDGKFTFKDWKETVKKDCGRVESKILDGRCVYLASLKIYFIEDQPYVFTVMEDLYEDLEKIFSKYENWKYVKREGGSSILTDQTNLSSNWALQNHPDGKCEIVRFIDVRDNEYQILINGVPMLPLGFPIPWGRRYNIIQQNLDIIRHDFAYGKSFISLIKNNVQLLDEMLRGQLMKFWQSIVPPRLNTTGAIVPQNIFNPGKITSGIPKDSLPRLMEDSNLTNAEFNMIAQIQAFVDASSVSPTFTGQSEGGNKTATQIVEVQRQGRIMLGTLILACSLLKKKESKLKNELLLQNWFDPVDTKADEVKQEVVDRYRVISRDRMIDGKQGTRFVVPTEEEYTTDDVYQQEQDLTKKMGKPIRLLVMKPSILKSVDYIWRYVVTAQEKKTSAMNKMLFSQEITDATNLGLPLNIDYVMEKFAEVWGDDPTKLFNKGQQPIPVEGGAGAGVIPNKIQPPSVKQLQTDIEATKI